MVPTCAFPGCCRAADRGGKLYCVFHREYSGFETESGESLPEQKTAAKSKKLPPVRSKGMKAKMPGYKKKVKEFLDKPEHRYCQLQLHGCGGLAVTVHHVKGRVGEQLMNEKDWMASCAQCNNWVEENDGDARELGLKKSRHAKA